MAAAGGLSFPLLEGVPDSYVHEAGQPLAAALGARMVEVGIADPADWRLADGNPIAFLEATLHRWQLDAGGQAVDREHIGVGAVILSDLRTFFWEPAEDARLDRMWIVFEQAGYHDLLEMRHVVTLLERVHPRLPATFERWFVGAIDTVGFVWNALAAREWMEMYGDWIVEREAEALTYARERGEEYETSGWPVRLDDRGRLFIDDMRLPALRLDPLAESTVRRMTPKLAPRVRKIMQLALEMRTAAESLEVRDRLHHKVMEELELYEFSHRIPPVFVLPMERYDAIERAWDEENVAMSQMGEPVQPLLAFHFDATDDDDLRWAHDTFMAVTRIYALAAELVPLLPTKDPTTLAETLVDLEVGS